MRNQSKITTHWHKAHKCGPTGKIMFKSHEAGTARGMEILTSFRVYRCHYCGGWHLTSKAD